MYIVNPSEKQYLLSHEKGEGIFCEILPPVLVMDGVEIRGHFNDNLQSWMGAFRLYTLSALNPEYVEFLWKGEDNQ